MDKQKILVEQIKQCATMQDVLSKCGIQTNKKRIPCPLHNGSNDNFSYNDNAFKCFKCGASGDVFTFVQQYNGITFSETVKVLAGMYGLSQNKPPTLGMVRKLKAQQEQREVERKEREIAKKEYGKLCDAYIFARSVDEKYTCLIDIKMLEWLLDEFLKDASGFKADKYIEIAMSKYTKVVNNA